MAITQVIFLTKHVLESSQSHANACFVLLRQANRQTFVCTKVHICRVNSKWLDGTEYAFAYKWEFKDFSH